MLERIVAHEGRYVYYRDENGLKQGILENHWPNGLLEVRCSFKDDKRNGIYEQYYDNGQLKLKCTYWNDEIDGPYEFYHYNGQLAVKSTYDNGKQNGPCTLYYEDGQVREKCTYKDGKLDGVLEAYYENGQLKEKSYWKDGNHAGPCEIYDANGNLESRSFFSYGTEYTGEKAEAHMKEWRTKQERLAEKQRIQEEKHLAKENIKVDIANLRGRLAMLSDPDFRRPIRRARTPERQAKAEEIIEVRRARALLSRAAKKAVVDENKELLSEIEKVAKPYAQHNQQIQLEFQKKRAERRAKKGRG